MQLTGISSLDPQAFIGLDAAAPVAPQVASTPTTAAPVPGQQPDADKLAAQASRLNQAFAAADTHLSFSVHKGDGMVVVKMIDDQTNQVIREIPNEKFLDLVDSLQKLAGTHVDLTR